MVILLRAFSSSLLGAQTGHDPATSASSQMERRARCCHTEQVEEQQVDGGNVDPFSLFCMQQLTRLGLGEGFVCVLDFVA